ncbi:hypothetical protein [Chroococcus sp. FPU101]|uniref:hypothetical protein n=1 Tax=Chroococcus sp. FPU101 TaxID=1974212 RepID=UPI001A8E1DD0|nr:hypothetical protein [Chroococcus sp. FPU101]GFE72119.1 hypothetical protein CFPU101_47290 [Chroococcus sp. FPU101]
MMKLQPETEKTLYQWLNTDTWHTKHPLDMKRWYDFVNQYRKDHGFSLDESSLQKIIESKLNVSGIDLSKNEVLQKVIEERISLAYNILDFLKHTGQ